MTTGKTRTKPQPKGSTWPTYTEYEYVCKCGQTFWCQQNSRRRLCDACKTPLPPEATDLPSTDQKPATEVPGPSKRHSTKGSHNGNAKLLEANVNHILWAVADDAFMAKLYNVTVSTINLIRKGYTWCHVPRPSHRPPVRLLYWANRKANYLLHMNRKKQRLERLSATQNPLS